MIEENMLENMSATVNTLSESANSLLAARAPAPSPVSPTIVVQPGICGDLVGFGPLLSTVPDLTPCFQSFAFMIPAVCIVLYALFRGVSLAREQPDMFMSRKLSPMTIACLAILLSVPLGVMASQDLYPHSSYFHRADCVAWVAVTLLLKILADRGLPVTVPLRAYVVVQFLIYTKFIESAAVAMHFDLLSEQGEFMAVVTILQAFLSLNLCVLFSTGLEGYTSAPTDMLKKHKRKWSSFGSPLLDEEPLKSEAGGTEDWDAWFHQFDNKIRAFERKNSDSSSSSSSTPPRRESNPLRRGSSIGSKSGFIALNVPDSAEPFAQGGLLLAPEIDPYAIKIPLSMLEATPQKPLKSLEDKPQSTEELLEAEQQRMFQIDADIAECARRKEQLKRSLDMKGCQTEQQVKAINKELEGVREQMRGLMEIKSKSSARYVALKIAAKTDGEQPTQETAGSDSPKHHVTDEDKEAKDLDKQIDDTFREKDLLKRMLKQTDLSDEERREVKLKLQNARILLERLTEQKAASCFGDSSN